MDLVHSPRSFVEFQREDTERSIPERFEQQVIRFPDRIAVKTLDQLLTYDTLNQRANRIARAIVEARGDTEEPVALGFTHGATMVGALLGALKAGKIVVPLEPAQPTPRLAAIVEDSQAGLLVTDTRSLPLAEGLGRAGLSVMNVDEVAETLSGENLGLSLSPDRLMHIMYTSGSTGRPKGVVQNHRNVLHAVMRYTNPPRVVADDRMVLLLSYARVAGMLQVFRALLNGAALFPFDVRQEGFARLADWLAREEITILQSVPSVFRHFAETLGDREQFPHLRLIHLGGDLVARHDVELYRRHFSAKCRLLNNFGATETATVCECFIDKTTAIGGNVVPVGSAVADVDVLLLDDDGQEVGTGQVGEIAVRSRYVALGYWRRPDLTRERFRPGRGDERVYLTGDLGRLRPDGCLVHLGRKDSQVKIRGNWIDIAEIEMALLEHPGVSAAAVAVTGRESGDPSLVAYVVPRHGRPPGSDELRACLKRTVPEFMVPSAFVRLQALPRTPEGKVDRQALSTLGPVRPALGGEDAPPIEAVQRQLAEIWEEILKIHPVGVRDDFFELGGHSLLAVRMMDRIEQVFGRKLPRGTLFGGATIERLAKALLSPETRDSALLLIEVQSRGAGRPFFFLQSVLDGSGEYCRGLARGLGEEQPFYLLAAHGQDGGPIPATIEERAASYVEMIRTVQPRGPYRLGGLWDGGVIAFEMARQLRTRGEAVAPLVLVAASSPPARFRRLRTAMKGAAFLSRMRRSSGAPHLDEISGADHLLVQSLVAGRRGALRNGGGWHRGPADRSRAIAESLGEAMARYVPGCYGGRIVLVFPGDSGALGRPDDRTAGWARVAREIEFRTVPGTPPVSGHVGAVASLMRGWLREAPGS